MAGSLTNAGEELALNLLFRGTGTQPTNIYLGLATNDVSTNSIGEDAVVGDISEEDDAGYSRQEVVFNAPTQVSGKATVDSNAEIEFGPWSADSDTAITYAFLIDNNDIVLGIFELPSSKQPMTGESILISAGNCVFDLD